ncbi:SDR family oxidoreductase [Bradyrhizobium elkanii]
MFSNSGMRVAIAARNPDKAALEALEKEHGVRRYGCDATDPVSIERLFEKVAGDIGAPRLVVHNIDAPRTRYFPQNHRRGRPGYGIRNRPHCFRLPPE